MMYRIKFILFFLLLIFSCGSISEDINANKKFALVIGNGNYDVSPLKNPVNDAIDISNLLKKLGFDVMTEIDANQYDMEIAVNRFARKLRSGGVGLFYYSGHGVQSHGSNYLIPVGSIKFIGGQEQLKYKTVDMGYVLGAMQDAGNNFNIVILDACRNNPFKGFLKGLQKGLTRVSGAEGMLIAYATSPGKTALDGTGRNSPYTKHLLDLIKKPNFPVEMLFKEVRGAVRKETNKKQTPWYEASIDGYFSFVQKEPTSSTAQTQPVRDIFQDRLKNGILGPKMKVLQAGTFKMGDIQGKGRSNEKPVHSVSLSQFAIGVYEVTFAEYDHFAEATGRKKPDDGHGRGDYPVINVSWHDATAYAEWLSEETGHKYRLLTEAEWEYAARAGSVTAYAFGNNKNRLGKYAWYYNNARKRMHPVGKKRANAWGLYDMHGNVWEWVHDMPSTYTSEAQTNPNGFGSGSARVVRGGGVEYGADHCRSAYRVLWGDSGYRELYLGFRLAMMYF